MSVSAVLTGQDVYRFFLGSNKKSKYAQEQGQDEDTQSKSGDTVQISEEAKKLAQEREKAEFIKEIKKEMESEPSPVLPPEAEAYALPKWFAELTPLQLVMPNDWTKWEPPSSEVIEYSNKLNSIYFDELDKHEVSGIENISNRKAKDESIRKAVLKRLQEDQRMCELMNIVGIKMPAIEK